MAERKSISIPSQGPADGTDRRHKPRKSHPCKGCFFFGGKAESVKCCNYYLITGKRRPCEPGKECTVRQDGSRSGRKSLNIKGNIGN